MAEKNKDAAGGRGRRRVKEDNKKDAAGGRGRRRVVKQQAVVPVK